MYQITAASKKYGKSIVLGPITTRIPTEGIVAIMGPSGSGKSTLLRLLSLVETPDTGSIDLHLDSEILNGTQFPSPWPKVTAVFQRQFLWPHLTLYENITLPLLLQQHGTNTIERVQSVIELFDMSEFVHRYPNEVSGGQAQRAALARALVLNPKIILIDEAHAGLDLEQQVILNEHLAKLSQTGVAQFVVTHSLAFSKKYANHLIVVENGSISEMGGRELLSEPSSHYLRTALRLEMSSGEAFHASIT